MANLRHAATGTAEQTHATTAARKVWRGTTSFGRQPNAPLISKSRGNARGIRLVLKYINYERNKGQFYSYLLAKYCKVWLKNSLHLLNDVRKRSTIHVLKNKIYDTIVVKRLVAHNYMWTLCCLIYFELLYYLLAHCFLNIHLNTLQKEL